jgi:hypothetical protein
MVNPDLSSDTSNDAPAIVHIEVEPVSGLIKFVEKIKDRRSVLGSKLGSKLKFKKSSIAAVGATAVLLLVIVCWQLNQITTTTIEKNVCAIAERDLKAKHFDEPINQLRKLCLAQAGNLTPKERALLNTALYERGMERADHKDYLGAVGDLVAVTAEFSKYDEVRDITGKYVQLADDQSRKHQKPNIESDKPPQPAPSVSKVPPPKAPLAKVTVNPVVIKQEQHSSDSMVPYVVLKLLKVKKPRPEPVAKVSTSKSIAETTKTNVSNKASVPQTPSSTSKTNKTAAAVSRKSPENDAARYNELLTAYFSKMSTSANHNYREPPSLNEWIKSGRHNF